MYCLLPIALPIAYCLLYCILPPIALLGTASKPNEPSRRGPGPSLLTPRMGKQSCVAPGSHGT